MTHSPTHSLKVFRPSRSRFSPNSTHNTSMHFRRWNLPQKASAELACLVPSHSTKTNGWGLRSNATRVIKHHDNDFTLQCFKCQTRRRYTPAASRNSYPHPTQRTIREWIAQAPPVDIRNTPSFRHFTTEEKTIIPCLPTRRPRCRMDR